MNALINVKKEKGWTSQDVCSKLRGILHTKKIGHTGTLDPNATGVLPVCVGSATKLCAMITDWNKIYECTMVLGLTSDSYDITGDIVKTASADAVNTLTANDIKNAAAKFTGKFEQYPPIYSARKVNGKKLYEYARAGADVEIKPKEIEVFSIDITEINLPQVKMKIKCSKGTYIRSICHDMGKELGVGALMDDLKRIKVGPFEYKDAYTIDEIQAYADSNQLNHILIPIENMFEDYDKAFIKDEFAKYAYNGNSIIPDDLIFMTNDECSKTNINCLHSSNDTCSKNDLPLNIRMYDSPGDFIGVYTLKDGRYVIEKFFYNKNI